MRVKAFLGITAAIAAAALVSVTVSVSMAQNGPAPAASPAPAAAPAPVGPLIPAAPMPTDDGHQVVRLFPGVAPGSEGWTQKEVDYGNQNGRGVRNVVDPSITVFLPGNSTAAAGVGVIIAPGGGFRFEQWDNEGTHIAEYLQKHGVASFVLKYRLTDTGSDEAFAEMNRQARGAIPPDSPQPAGAV